MTLAISNYIEKQRIAPPLTTSHYLLTTFVYSELCERSLDYRFAQVPNARLGPIFKKDENHPFISLFLEMGRRWATRWLGSARRSV